MSTNPVSSASATMTPATTPTTIESRDPMAGGYQYERAAALWFGRC
jgi:hypothetical protein